jgi:hypothetical protein
MKPYSPFLTMMKRGGCVGVVKGFCARRGRAKPTRNQNEIRKKTIFSLSERISFK